MASKTIDNQHSTISSWGVREIAKLGGLGSTSKALSEAARINRKRHATPLQRRLDHRITELALSAIIVANLIVVIIETDLIAQDIKPYWWIDVASWVILLMFVVELGLRTFAFKRFFWADVLNVYDFMVVSADLALHLFGLFAADAGSFTFLRIIRLSKILRLSKAFLFFPELRLMMAGFLGAVRSVIWGAAFLFLFIIIWSIVATQLIHPLNKKIADSGGYEGCDRCARCYSSVFHASLTIWQQIVTGDSWGTVNIKIIEHYPAAAVFFGLCFLSIGIAVLNLILGVIVDVASHARNKLHDDLEMTKVFCREAARSSLYELCQELDADGSGEITIGEIEEGYKENIEFRSAVGRMGVDEEDLSVLFSVLDMDHSGGISHREFVKACSTLKTSDTNYMLAYIKHYVVQIKKLIQQSETRVTQVVQDVTLEVETTKSESSGASMRHATSDVVIHSSISQEGANATSGREKEQSERGISLEAVAEESEVCEAHPSSEFATSEDPDRQRKEKPLNPLLCSPMLKQNNAGWISRDGFGG